MHNESQKYVWITPNLLRKMCSDQSGQTLRRAMRIFCLLKKHCSAKIPSIKEAESTLYAHHVSRHQAKKYLPYLIEHQFIGQSKQGVLFLRGTRWMVEQDKGYKRTGLIGISFDAIATSRMYEDHIAALFIRFIAGHVYYGKASEKNRKNQESYIKELKCQDFSDAYLRAVLKNKWNVPGVNRPEPVPLRAQGYATVPLSNSLIHRFAPTRSKMTISRWRKRATVQHHEDASMSVTLLKSAEPLDPVLTKLFKHVKGDWKTFRRLILEARDRPGASPLVHGFDVNRLTMHCGKLSVQTPSVIGFEAVPMRLKTSWHGSHLSDRKDSKSLAGMAARNKRKERNDKLRTKGIVEDQSASTLWVACQMRRLLCQ